VIPPLRGGITGGMKAKKAARMLLCNALEVKRLRQIPQEHILRLLTLEFLSFIITILRLKGCDE